MFMAPDASITTTDLTTLATSPWLSRPIPIDGPPLVSTLVFLRFLFSYNAILPIQAGQDFHLRMKLKPDCTRNPLKFHALTVQ